MRKYRASGQACLAKIANSEDSLQNINCTVFGDDPINACENLINNNMVTGLDHKLMFVAVSSDTPAHLECPLTGGFLSFIELDD